MPKIYFSAVFIACLFATPLFAVNDSPGGHTEITAVVLRSFPPHYMTDQNGLPSGFAIDVMNNVADIAGVRVTYLQVDTWSEMLEAVKSGEADIIPNLGITDKRKEWLAFTSPVETYPVSIFVRTATDFIRGEQDLAGHKVAVVEVNVGVRLIENRAGVEMVVFEDVEKALFELLAGKVEALVYPEPVLLKIAIEAGITDLIKTAGAPLIEIKRAISVRKDNTALLERLDGAVKKFTATAEYREIYLKWYGRQAPFWTADKVLLLMAGVLALAVSIMAFWRYMSLVQINRSLNENIDARKLTERELLESTERFSTVIKSAANVIVCLSPDHKIFEFNPEAERLYGMKRNDVIGKDYFTLFLPEDVRATVKADMIKVLEGKPSRGFENEVMSKNGELHALTWSVNRLIGSENESKGIIAIAQDITERKKAEEEKDKFLLAIETAKEGINIIDRDHVIIYANKAIHDMFGYDQGELIGMQVTVMNHPHDEKRIAQEIMLALQDTGGWEGEIHNIRKDGASFISYATVAAIKDKKGDMVHVVSTQHDVSEHKKLEEQLMHAQKMEAVGQLAGGIAHEFNNILTAIINNAYLIKNKLSMDAPAQKNLDTIFSLSNNAAGIARELLAFSRKQVLDLAPVKLNDIIAGTESLLGSFIGEDIELQVRLSDRDPLIMADKNQIEQIIMNLATNSRASMPKGGRLTVETDLIRIDGDFIKSHGFGRTGMFALLSVTDTGTGMDRATVQKIFEPFFTTKELGKGTGLGLSIVYGIVRQHEGYISVDSESGKGATFRIYLPEIKGEIRDMKDREETLPDLKGHAQTILLAEDEMAVRESVRTILEEFNYTVIEAVDGKDAVEKFLSHKDQVQLLILDVIMPKKNGKDTYEAIRKIRPDIKALFISGYSSDILTIRQAIGEDIILISKPILPDKFLMHIKKAFAR